MVTPSTRRAALGAILAAPLASVPVVANFPDSGKLPDDEARFLAIGPQLVQLLNEYDRLWAVAKTAHADWWKAGEHLPSPRWPAMESLPEWKVYSDLVEPAEKVGDAIRALYEPFDGLHLTSLRAVLLRCRWAASFGCEEEAMADIVRLWREGTLCA
ncbi:hypothetical protein [Methylobacterium sp. J-070]|uniref:hypothetical protein n=1 Tax=Methylobacterium sp. J-070 TaxID=2836650 RepID=UPI001FBAF4CC|nr:hypothetical protein [Methylobacterium sp. J-070]MCJ2049324.1 hypothetical protein [Methylobacterium sp. J-070]